MSTALIPFQFERFTVRALADEDGNSLFVAKDAAEALEYKDPTTAIKSHCKGVQELHPLQTVGGTQNVRVIREPDLYRLIAGSTLPSAARFERWLFEEVLPTIRKSGRYMGHPHKASRSRPPDPIILHRRRADAIIASTLRVGHLLGTELAMARTFAVDEARRETGIDYRRLLPKHEGQNISANAMKPCQSQGCSHRRPTPTA